MGAPQPDTVEPTDSQTEPAASTSVAATTPPVKHGYPPPRLSPGEVTTAYCGEPMVVEGAVSDQPPRDACPLCALAWRARRKRPPWL